MDILLPGIDGVDTCRKLKSIKGLATVPLIAVAAAFGAGAWDFLGKPRMGPELLGRGKAALAKKKEFDEML